MAGFASLGTLDIWYAKMSEDDVRTGIEHIRRSLAAKEAKEAKRGRPAKTGKPAVLKKEAVALQRSEEALRRAHNRTNLQALSKLTEVVDGKQRIISQPPVLIPLRELALSAEFDALDLQDVVRQIYGRYRDTLSDTRRRLLDEHTIVDVARKVVGVGSVGTRAFVVLLQGRDERDPLFLQVKEATRSVLEAHLPKSRYDNCGERVVQGQQLMQSASDIFLGWSAGVQTDRYYYWRQLRDMKGSADVEAMIPKGLIFYAQICGWTLARAHARSGDAVAMAACLGDDRAFDKAFADFAERYADQNELDYQAFRDSIASGRIEARPGV
jgi:uncharacterized protein (DUF2252 family)